MEHCSNSHPSGAYSADLVLYAQGPLELSANQKALSGELKVWRNMYTPAQPPIFGNPATPEDAFADVGSPLTVFITVSDAGQASLQKKVNGNPIYGFPPVALNATYNGGLFVEQSTGVVKSLSFSLA